MTSAPSPSITPPNPAEDWTEILKATLLRVPTLPEDLFKKLRRANLTFGDRVHCPFLRPFFLSPEEEERVRAVAETIADLGERVVMPRLQTNISSRNFIYARKKKDWCVFQSPMAAPAPPRVSTHSCCRNP